MVTVVERCGLCGGELDDHNIRLTVEFAAGLRNGNHFLTVPSRLGEWPLCWTCFTGPSCEVLRKALADEYMEPVIDRQEQGCRAVCRGSKWVGVGRWRRFFGSFQGRRGDAVVLRCPACWGPAEVERAA